MTKTDMINDLAKKLGVTKRLAGDFLTTFVELVITSVKKGDDVRLTGFGTFSVSHRAARTGVNPQNPSQKIQIPAMDVPRFKAGSDFRKALRG
jgi:DNA-binding protein HU-beta